MKIILITLIYILGPILIILLYNQFKILQKMGTIVLAYTVGIVLSLSGIMQLSGEEKELMGKIQEWIMNIAVPLAIPLMLFSSDFKLWKKSLKKTFAALIGGLLSVIIATFAGYLIFKNQGIDELWKASGMMIGTYTGGTMNFVAIGKILDTNPTVFTLVSTFEMVISFVFLLFMIGGGYKIFRKILPFHDDSISLNEHEIVEKDYVFEIYKGMLKPKSFGKTMLALVLSFSFLVVGAGLALLISGRLNELIVIFTITGLGIAFSFVKKIRTLPKSFELGIYFILVFSIVISSQFDIYTLNTKNLMLLAFIAFILIASVILHLLFSRLFKIDGDLFSISNIALIFSAPFVPAVAGAMGNKKILISGIIIGLIGYAIGTYLGVGVAEILRIIN